jgi:hypothetical protein
MKKNLLITFLSAAAFYYYIVPANAEVSWDNPAVLCPEEILPSGLNCLDFSQVENPYTDFPDETTIDEMIDWKNNKAADLKVCRNKEVLRREKVKPGSYSPATLEQAWMVIDGGKQVAEKLDAIESASIKYQIPPQVLIGAMKQESLMSSLGISPDGGNYSCGMSQLNIQEWCLSMNRLPEGDRLALGWPSISCEPESIPNDIVKPFYDIAIKRAGNRPSYQLTSEDFNGITKKDVSKGSSRSGMKEFQFQAATSFVKNCQNIFLSVSFKARTLKSLFENFVPTAMKESELYEPGKTFPRTCKNAYTPRAYPLHTGWLLAVAMYNAGPQQAKLLEHYYKVKKNIFPPINPLGLIEALHWGGKWKKRTDDLIFKDQYGDKYTQSWFKSCIVQRHIAKVIQHVTLPAESIAKSLEKEGCKTSGVPDYRKDSTGVK